MMPVKGLLKKFSHLLVCYWQDLLSLSENDSSGSLKDDWLQANWEILVEGPLSQEDLVLDPYGEGADCNEASSRVLYPTRLPTHKIICKPVNNGQFYDVLNKRQLDTSKGEVVFDRFVCIGEDGWFYELPPFDRVLGEYLGESVVVDFDSTDFQLQRIT